MFSNDKGDQKGVTRESNAREEAATHRVIVNIWTSGGNPSYPGHNVGHASIQCREQYMSLWPRRVQNEGSGIKEGISFELLPNYQTDLNYERRAPEVRFCFYSLETDKIEKAFDEIKKTLEGWSLLGLEKKSESCASLAWHLLKAGGIDKLVSLPTQSSVSSAGSSTGSFLSGKQATTSSVHGSSSAPVESKAASAESRGASFFSTEMAIALVVKSPDALADLLRTAKKQELKSHANTSEIAYPGETVVQVSSSKCLIM